MKILKVKRPKQKFTEEQLKEYFSNQYSDEVNNIIDGYAWTQYLTKHDYKRYLKHIGSDVEQLRIDLKEQIINLLKNNNNNE